MKDMLEQIKSLAVYCGSTAINNVFGGSRRRQGRNLLKQQQLDCMGEKEG